MNKEILHNVSTFSVLHFFFCKVVNRLLGWLDLELYLHSFDM